MPNVYHTKEEMIDCVNAFYEGMVRRSEEMKRHPNYKTGENYAYLGLPPCFLIFDEYVAFFEMLGTPLEEADIINRFEIRLRNERAYYAVRDLLTYYDAEQTAFSIINQYVRFVDEEPEKRKNDWKLNDRWAWFIGDNRQSLKLTTKPEPYTLDRTLRWVQRQVAPTLKMLKKIDKGNGTDYMETIEQQAKLTEKLSCSNRSTTGFRVGIYCKSIYRNNMSITLLQVLLHIVSIAVEYRLYVCRSSCTAS